MTTRTNADKEKTTGLQIRNGHHQPGIMPAADNSGCRIDESIIQIYSIWRLVRSITIMRTKIRRFFDTLTQSV